MLAHDAAVLRSDDACSLHELLLLERKRLAARQACDANPVNKRQGSEQQEQSVEQLSNKRRPQRSHDDDEEQQVGKGIKDVSKTHQQVVRPPSFESCKHTDRHANQQNDDQRHKADHQRHTGAVHDPAEHIASQGVRAQEKLR